MTIDISNVTSQGPHIGSYRTTRYETKFLHFGANEIGFEGTERNVGGEPIRVVVHESLYTAEQIAIIHAAMSLIEAGVAIVHGEKEDALKLAGIDIPREEVAKLVREADEAKAAKKAAEDALDRLRDEEIVEAKRIEIERKAAEEELAAKRAEIATLKAEAAAMAKGKPASPPA